MKKMSVLLSICAVLLMSAMVFAQVPAAAPKADAKPAVDMATKTVTGMLTIDVAKKEASIKVGEKTTKLEWNMVVEGCKLAGKNVEAKGTMKADVLTVIEIKEATAAPLAPKADAPKADVK